MTRREELLWMAAACVPILMGLLLSGGILLGDDAYQYLSGAENFAAGRGVSTSLLHYDTERAGGVVPAPLTMRPTGYSLLIAALHAVGLSFETAAGVTSALAFLVLIPILAEAARAMGLTPLAYRSALVWLLTNSWVFVYPVAATTESLFTAVSTCAVTLVLFAEQQSAPGRSWLPLLAASILAGLSYWIRYAGLLVCAGIAAYYGLCWLSRRRRADFARLLIAAGPASVFIAASALRNAMLTGSWRSGYDHPGMWTVAGLLRQLAASVHHLLLGDVQAAQFGVPEMFLAGSALALGVLAVRVGRDGRRSSATGRLSPSEVLLGIVVLVYLAGLTAIARVSTITFDTRMLYPLLPLILLAAAVAVTRLDISASRGGRVVLAGSLTVATAMYGMINYRSIVPRLRGSHEAVTTRLAGPVREWIDEHIPNASLIVATDGQATGYVLRRPTISLAPPEFSATEWTENAVRRVMDEFGARFLIVYRVADDPNAARRDQSAFLASLEKDYVPSWLSVAIENSSARVFRLAE